MLEATAKDWERASLLYVKIKGGEEYVLDRSLEDHLNLFAQIQLFFKEYIWPHPSHVSSSCSQFTTSRRLECGIVREREGKMPPLAGNAYWVGGARASGAVFLDIEEWRSEPTTSATRLCHPLWHGFPSYSSVTWSTDSYCSNLSQNSCLSIPPVYLHPHCLKN